VIVRWIITCGVEPNFVVAESRLGDRYLETVNRRYDIGPTKAPILTFVILATCCWKVQELSHLSKMYKRVVGRRLSRECGNPKRAGVEMIRCVGDRMAWVSKRTTFLA